MWMRAEKDFVEFLGSFNKNKVKYCIIGAFAVGLYGYPRYTKDMDILVEPTPGNAKKVIKALREFGFSTPDLTEKDFSQKNKVIQLGYEPIRIDLLTSIKGFGFARIWRHKTKAKFGKEEVFFIGRKELIEAKKKANRQQDRVDLKKLAERRD